MPVTRKSVRQDLTFNTPQLRGHFNEEQDVDPVLHFFTLVGRNKTSDTQTEDAIINTNSQVRVNMNTSLTDTDVLTSLIDVTAAGNAAVAGNLTSGLYEIHAFVYIYNCTATVAARATIAPKLQNLYDAGIALPIPINSLDWYAGSTLALAASQDGFVALIPGGVEVKNQNNAATYTSNLLRLPLTVRIPANINLAVTVSCAAATNGQALDTHRVILWGRQLA